MSEPSRRDVVKMAAGLAVGSGMAFGSPAAGQEPQGAGARDALLALALGNPQGFMLTGPATFRVEGDGASRDLIITSARDPQGRSTPVHVPSWSMRVIRADADVDEFTKQGGLYWRFRDKQGKLKLKSPGEIVMVVREDNTVRCYLMTPDARC
jgi:hypothetical protein